MQAQGWERDGLALGAAGLARPPMPGLETSSGPTPGLCSGVLPVSDPLLGGRPSHTHPCAAERPPALWLLAPGASCLAGPAGCCPASLPGACLPACPEAPVKPQWLQPRAQSLGNLLHLPTTLEAEPSAHRAVLSLGGRPKRIPIPSPTPGMKPQRSFFTLRLTDAQDWVRSWGRGCRDRARCQAGGNRQPPPLVLQSSQPPSRLPGASPHTCCPPISPAAKPLGVPAPFLPAPGGPRALRAREQAPAGPGAREQQARGVACSWHQGAGPWALAPLAP